MLPALAVQVPVAAVISIVTAVVFFTALRDDAVVSSAEVLEDGSRGAQLLVFATVAVQLLFAQVARAASILGIAAALTGQPKSLNECLDPAFTRMGAILGLTVAVGGLLFVLAASIVLIPIALYLALRMALTFEACVLEEAGIGMSLRRSWELMRGRMLRFTGNLILLLLTLIGPLAIISLLNLLILGGRDMEVVSEALVSFLIAVLAIPLITVATAFTTLTYFQALGGARVISRHA
ncbi:MAG: glycerophosphoryl diester phosphodiesterase membrane domain-containing protein [Dehalococcoidia bacterium]